MCTPWCVRVGVYPTAHAQCVEIWAGLHPAVTKCGQYYEVGQERALRMAVAAPVYRCCIPTATVTGGRRGLPLKRHYSEEEEEETSEEEEVETDCWSR